jgi:hypothetical protein
MIRIVRGAGDHPARHEEMAVGIALHPRHPSVRPDRAMSSPTRFGMDLARSFPGPHSLEPRPQGGFAFRRAPRPAQGINWLLAVPTVQREGEPRRTAWRLRHSSRALQSGED